MPPTGRILVVADDDDQRELFTFLLTRAGYPVVDVATGEKALACLATERFDLLLTDYLLPGILGNQLISYVQEEGLPMKTILMSNYVDANAIARDCDADGCFRKEDCRLLLMLTAQLLSAGGAVAMAP